MIHPSAYIHPDAKIAENVSIGPFATIAGDVSIGQGTHIESHASVMDGARIGENCHIHQGAVIACTPQDLKFKGEKTEAIIGDHTTVREYVTISRGTADRHKTVIGQHCLIMAYVHIAHDCLIGNYCIFSNSTQLAGHVVVEDYVVIAGMSAVHQFVKIGQHAFVGGGSLVRKDVPPFIMAAREPLSYCGINATGLKRRSFDQKKINDIQEVYRIVFTGGLNIAKASEKIQHEVAEFPERDHIVNFITSSERGIIKGY